MLFILFYLYLYRDHRDLHVLTHAFPTRRSSHLADEVSAFDEVPKPLQGVVPLRRDAVEIGASLGDRFGTEREAAFTADPAALHQPRGLQNAKVLGDRLPSEARIRREPRDRTGLAVAELHQERQAGPVSQGGDDRLGVGGRSEESRVGRGGGRSVDLGG